MRHSLCLCLAHIVIMLCPFQLSAAQDIRDAKPVELSGGISVQHTYYQNLADTTRVDPLGHVLSGYLHTTLYGLVDLPFSFYLSRNTQTLSHPEMNRFGVSPRYKDLTIHAGYRMLRLSDYSFNGVQFLGTGLSYEPEERWWQGTFFYGRLLPAYSSVEITSADQDVALYDRYGYGGKMRFGRAKQHVSFLLFRAEDRYQAKEPVTDSIIGGSPQENLVLGLQGYHQLGARWLFQYDYCLSFFSPDITMPESPVHSYTYANNMPALFTPRLGSLYAHALSVDTRYASRQGRIGLVYRLIEPDYQSLGTAYQQNDNREIMLEAARQAVSWPWGIQLRAGLQENNLREDQQLTNRRVIASLGLQYAPGNWNLQIDHANYNTSTSPSSIAVRDTARYVQVSKNSLLSIQYRFHQPVGAALQYRFVFQTVDMLNENASYVTVQDNRIVNQMLSGQFRLEPLSLALMPAFHGVHYHLNDSMSNRSIQPLIRFSGRLLKETLQWQLQYAYRLYYSKDVLSEKGNQLQAGLTFRCAAQHTVQFRCSFTQRQRMGRSTGQLAFQSKGQGKNRDEIRATLQYNYRLP